MNIIVIGSTGQLGREFVKLGAKLGGGLNVYEIEGRDDADVSDFCDIHRRIGGLADKCLDDGNGVIHAVVNTAAMHDAKECAAEPIGAFGVNAEGAANVAFFCRSLVDKPICVYISTDYVFGGLGTKSESGINSPVAPFRYADDRGVYGCTKAAGEMATEAIAARSLIIRVSTLFGPEPCKGKSGPSFVERVLHRAGRGEPMEMTADTHTSVSYAPEVARVTVEWLEKILKNPAWTRWRHHAVCHPSMSHYNLAEFICERARLRADISPISTVGTPRRSGLLGDFYSAGDPHCVPLAEAIDAYLEIRNKE